MVRGELAAANGKTPRLLEACGVRVADLLIMRGTCCVASCKRTCARSAQTFKKAVEEGLELLARRNGSEPNPDVSVWDALDPDDPRNQEAGEEGGDEGGGEDAGLGRDIRPQVGWFSEFPPSP